MTTYPTAILALRAAERALDRAKGGPTLPHLVALERRNAAREVLWDAVRSDDGAGRSEG